MEEESEAYKYERLQDLKELYLEEGLTKEEEQEYDNLLRWQAEQTIKVLDNNTFDKAFKILFSKED